MFQLRLIAKLFVTLERNLFVRYASNLGSFLKDLNYVLLLGLMPLSAQDMVAVLFSILFSIIFVLTVEAQKQTIVSTLIALLFFFLYFL